MVNNPVDKTLLFDVDDWNSCSGSWYFTFVELVDLYLRFTYMLKHGAW